MWLQIKKNGVYYTNENLSQLLHPRDHLLEDEFTKAYRWMAKQMQEKKFLYLRKMQLHLSDVGMRKMTALFPKIGIIQIKLVSS